MSERPILFSAPMVRAILEGRKSQTRRVVNPQPVNPVGDPGFSPAEDVWRWDHENVRVCPYGAPWGDRLWVRETWTGTWCYEEMHLAYAADGSERTLEVPDVPQDYALPKAAIKPGAWVTPLFMPRWASRLTLEITDVRVQRVQEISEEDAQAEGVEAERWVKIGGENGASYRMGFRSIWDHINAKRGYSWQSNPWVWAVSFRRVA